VQWDRLFEDLEGQLASEWEAERAALDAESERLRIAKLELRQRLTTLQHRDGLLIVELLDGSRHRTLARAVGADWVGMQAPQDQKGLLVPFRAITSLETDHGMLLDSLEDAAPSAPSLRERMSLGFVLRDLARRRIPIRVGLRSGTILHGTADRAGADHLDLAVHDPGEPRRAEAVHGFRMIPFDALVWVSTERAAPAPY
jgi:hypothetical protein